MSAAAIHNIYADLPSGISQSAMTALANALNLIMLPIEKGLFKPSNDVAGTLERLSSSKPNLSFIFDLGQLASAGLNVIQVSEKLESAELRNRIFFCNSERQVSIGTRNLVKQLGFAEIVADLDPRDSLGGMKLLSEWICRRVPTVSERLNRIPAYLKTVSLSSGSDAPRAIVQRMTGHCAEILTADLVSHIQVRDRSFRLKTYQACFLGTDLCEYLKQKFRLLEAQSLIVGNALQDLGLIYHVAHEKRFANEDLFFRFAVSAAADKLPALEVWKALQSDLEIKDRSYLGKNYPKSFIGSEAINTVAKRWSLSRADAWIVLHRFEQLGLFAHVTKDHGMIDGNFFYRIH